MMKFCYVMPKHRINEKIFDALFFRKGLFYDYRDDDQAANLFLSDIRKEGFFMDRETAEVNQGYVQIIPSFVLRSPGHVLFYQRKAKHTEQRLASKWTCLFGGHIDPSDYTEEYNKINLLNTDITLPKVVNSSLVREMEEETGMIAANKTIMLKGFLYDHRDKVGQVHMGIVFEVSSTLDIQTITKIESKTEIGDIKVIPVEDLKKNLSSINLEGWADIMLPEIEHNV